MHGAAGVGTVQLILQYRSAPILFYCEFHLFALDGWNIGFRARPYRLHVDSQKIHSVVGISPDRITGL